MKKLIANEGYVYCNGWASGKVINLPDEADESAWVLMLPEEAAAWIEETIQKEMEREEELDPPEPPELP